MFVISTRALCPMHRTIAAVVLYTTATVAALALAGCATSPPANKRLTPFSQPTGEMRRAWRALRLGAIDASGAAFAGLRARATGLRMRELALAGALRVALVRRDATAMARLLSALPGHPREPRLLLAGALTALRLGRMDDKTRPLLERACALAKVDVTASKARRQPAVDALNVCSARALMARYPRQRRCLAGCKTEHLLPLRFVGAQPVVMVSVNGQPPAPFIVDTGAGTSLLTERYAKQIAVAAVPGTRLLVGSPGGLLTVHRAAVKLQLGGLALADVPVILVALPFEGIAGVISPHDSFGQLVTRLDFRAFTMRIGAGRAGGDPQGDASLARWPLIVGEGTPMVRVAVGGRPPRPLIIDTGADRTTLALTLDRLGAALPRAGEGKVSGAGDKQARSWAIKASVPARAGDLSFRLDRARLVERGKQPITDVETFGLLGMDFLMGRRLVVDVPGRQVLVSRSARLAPWQVGARARFEMVGSHFAGQRITVSEQVTAAAKGEVTLDVTIDRKQTGPRHERRGKTRKLRGKARKLVVPAQQWFRLVMRDSWFTRGSWLITRRARRYLEGSAKRPKQADPKALRGRWMQLMASFRTTGTKPRIKMITMKIDGAEFACTETEIGAQIAGKPARLRLWECPASPWRMTGMELREGDVLRWGFRRF